MSTGLPQWSTRVPAPRPSGRFPLALEALGAGIVARYIFPGFTNATREARYFSFLSWVFWSFDEYRSRRVPKDRWPLAQHRWRVRIEHAMRCCTQLVALQETGTRARGLVGVLKTPDLRAVPSGEEVALGGKRVEKIVTAFDPAFYGSPFVALGLGLPIEGRIHLSALGEAAGEAFEKTLREGISARERAALATLMDASARMTAGQLRALSARLTLRPLSPGEPEQVELLRVLFRLEARDQQPPPFADEDRHRRLGLARVLDVVSQGDGLVKLPRDCHAIFATRGFTDERPIETPKPLRVTDDAWQRYEERQHQKVAVSAFWHETLELLENEHAPPRSAGEIVSHSLALLERSQPLRKWLGDEALSLRVAEATSRAMVRAARSRRTPAAICHSLTRQIQNAREDVDAAARLGRALISLLLTMGAWRSASLSDEQRMLHRQSGAARLSLGWMADELERRSEQRVADAVRWLIEHCVLSQAIRVAYEKTDSRGRTNRFFIERGDGGYRIVQVHPLEGRFAFDAARLEGAFGLMRSLGLVDIGAAGGYRVTAGGRRMLKAVIALYGEDA